MNAPLRGIAVIGLLVLCGCHKTMAPRAATGPSLRLLTYNENWGAPSMRDAAEIIRAANADVVCLQETTPEWELYLRAALRTNYPVAAFRSSQGRMGGGLAFLSRVPRRDVAYIPSATGWFDGWISGFETPSGAVQVLNVHLRPPVSDRGGWASGYLTTGDERLEEIDRFHSFRDPRLPLFVAGDFNDNEDSAAARFLARAGLTNALPLFDRRAPTWHWRVGPVTLRRRMDHVLFPPAFECVNARVLPSGGSDHFAVLAEFERR